MPALGDWFGRVTSPFSVWTPIAREPGSGTEGEQKGGAALVAKGLVPAPGSCDLRELREGDGDSSMAEPREDRLVAEAEAGLVIG